MQTEMQTQSQHRAYQKVQVKLKLDQVEQETKTHKCCRQKEPVFSAAWSETDMTMFKLKLL